MEKNNTDGYNDTNEMWLIIAWARRERSHSTGNNQLVIRRVDRKRTKYITEAAYLSNKPLYLPTCEEQHIT